MYIGSNDKEHLKDIQRLGNKDNSYLIDYAEHYLYKIKMEYIEKSNLSNFSFISNILKREIVSLLKIYFLDEFGIENINFSIDKNLNIHSWERILEILSLFLETAHYFKFKKTLNIHIKKNSIDFLGEINCVLNKQSVKKELTRIFKELLEKKVIVIHKYMKFNESYKSIISFDYSYQEHLLYFLDMKYSGEKIKLAFPNNVANYHCGTNKLKQLDDHLCLELTDRLDLIKLNKIPSYFLADYHQKDLSKCVLHFPFIFRPISMIIPRRGKIIPVNQTSERILSGDGKIIKNEQNFSLEEHRQSIYYMDIFSFSS